MLAPSRFTAVLFSCLLFSLLVACSHSNNGDSDNNDAVTTPWPGGVWEPEAASYGMTVVRDVPVTMDDGVILHANIGYPAEQGTDMLAAGTFPVLLTQNPYTDGGEPDEFFVGRGYIHAVTEIRGTGNSQLSATDPDGPLATDSRGPRDALDGANLVAWAADIDRSNGRLGLYGCSWLGIVQILTAGAVGENSPVKAMIPACAGQNYNIYFVGGVAVTVVQYFDLSGNIVGTKHAPENVADGAALKNDILSGGERAFNRSYWLDRTSYTRVEDIVKNDIPTLLWTGWQAVDGVTDAIDLYSALQNAQAGRSTLGPMPVGSSSSGKFQIVVGPGGHGEGIDKILELEWYDHWVKEKKTQIDLTKTGLHLYEQGADRWVNVSSWPITDEYTPLYLADNGLSSTAVSHTAELAFGDPTGAGTTVSYDSAPFSTERTLAGPIGATLYVKSSNTNAHFVLTLFDVAPDDSIAEIISGGLIASGRELNTVRSWYDKSGLAIKPEGTFASNQFLVPGEQYRLDIELQPTLRRIPEGHRLRLVIGTQAGTAKCTLVDISSALRRPSPCVFNTIQQASLDGGTYEILSDAMNPSSINLPLIAPSSLPTARSNFTETSPEQTQPLDWGQTL